MGLWKKAKSLFRSRWKDAVLSQMPSEAEYPSDEELNLDPALNKFIATAIREQYVWNHRLAQQVSADIGKWLLTSMLAVNAGGAVAVAQLDLPKHLKVASGALFVVGLILPMIAGQLSIRSGMILGGPIGKALGYWGYVEHTGERDRDDELEVNSMVSEAFKHMTWPYRLAYASTGLFILASSLAGIGLMLR